MLAPSLASQSSEQRPLNLHMALNRYTWRRFSCLGQQLSMAEWKDGLRNSLNLSRCRDAPLACPLSVGIYSRFSQQNLTRWHWWLFFLVRFLLARFHSSQLSRFSSKVACPFWRLVFFLRYHLNFRWSLSRHHGVSIFSLSQRHHCQRAYHNWSHLASGCLTS